MGEAVGDCFHFECLLQSSGVLPGFKYGIQNTVKNNSLIEQKAWERGNSQATLLEGGRGGQGEETYTQRPWEGFYSKRVMWTQRD